VSTTPLARRLGPFDATMIVMGGIIGSGIFINPYVVARTLPSTLLILGVWAAGGAIALIGAFVYAELAALRPEVGGEYAYLRDAWHPAVAFLYGWAFLLVIQSGSMAAVAVAFANYANALAGTNVPAALLAVVTLTILTLVNCLGVRSGANTQTVLMLLKLLALLMLIGAGLTFSGGGQAILPEQGESGPPVLQFFGALTPVMFAYGGWQTASFMSGELRRPRRDLAIGLLAGVAGVIAVYLLVNWTYLGVLGPAGLAMTTTPASAVMRAAWGERGATLIAAGITISTLGILSQGMLTAPRLYFAMAEDRLFFRSVATVHPKTQVPVVAIALQGIVAVIIALSGTYEQILSYVVSVGFIFFGLTGAALFVFRRRQASEGFRTPGHPVTTAIFVAACLAIVIATFVRAPRDSAIGVAMVIAGLPAYLFWRRRAASR
jgi:basic amino acid/polyamine antiporter, APA family